MKLPIPWRRRPTGQPEPEIEEEPADEEAPIDITEPRECIYKSFEDHPGPCPRCGGPLQQSHQTYLILTTHGERIMDSFIIGSDFGWFCLHCPTVVIDPADVGEMLQFPLPHWDTGDQFVVAGIVDLDAVPEEKDHLPLGSEDNPIPLVEFTNLSGGAQPRRPARASGSRRAPKRQKKPPQAQETSSPMNKLKRGNKTASRNGVIT